MITNALGVPPKLTNQSREIHLNLNLSTVDYEGFVELVEQHQVNSWL